MTTKVLIVGLATDGPDNKVALMRDERDLLRVFGGLYTERSTISATASAVSLSYDPYKVPTTILNGTQRNYLYAPSLSGQIILFGSVGGTGAQLDLQYTPYLGKGDLVWAARNWIQNTGQMPYIARVPGQRATLEVGNWRFAARYHGLKYNDVLISYTSGGVLTISGLEPNYPSLTYSGYNINDLQELVDRDFEIGTSPVYIERATSTLSTFSRNLTGGLDGSWSDTSFQQMLDGINIPTDCSHILFLAPVTSGYVTILASHMALENVQPRMMLFSAPDYTPTVENYLFSLSSTLPVRHSMLGLVLGTVRMELNGRIVDRYAIEGASLALAQSQNGNLTNLPIPARSFYPQLSETELDNFKLGGIMCVARHILNDISTYEAVTSSRANTFLFSSKIAEIAALVYSYLLPLLGSIWPSGPSKELSDALIRRLAPIEWITIESVQCVVVQDTLYVSIQGALPDEILKINFTVKNI